MPNDAYALSSMVLELTGTSLGAIFRCKIFNKIKPMANAYWMTDTDGVSIPTAGLFLTARDRALIANFIQESINQSNCMGKYLKEDINSASKSSSTK